MKKIKYLIPILIVSSISVATLASPILKEIKAHYKQNLQYTLNGDEVLLGKGGLIYEDRVYIPLRDMAELLDINVDYKDNTVILKEKTVLKDEELVKKEGIHFSGLVKSINYEEREILILREGQEDIFENYILLRLTDDSLVKNLDNEKSSLEVLEVGTEIKGTHSPHMTFSIPAQGVLYELQITKPISFEQENVTIEKVKVINVDKDTQTIIVQNDKIGEYHIKVNQNTFIKHELNKRLYYFEDLTIGQILDIEIPPIMTMIYPPRTSAISIIIFE